jgi:hypothetical protein
LAKRKSSFKKRPTQGDFVRWRNRKGQITKPKSGVYLIGEIVSKKTGKIVGYLNSRNKETKKPNPQRFTAAQRAILSSPKPLTKGTEKKISQSKTFKIKSTSPIIDQIPAWVTKKVNEEQKQNDEILVAFHIKGTNFQVETESTYIDKKLSHDTSRKMFGIDIYKALTRANVRMSPKLKGNDKQAQRQRVKKHSRQVSVQLIIRGFD